VYLARPARCDTPVPQPLSARNSIKAWYLNRFGAGEGMADFICLIEGFLHRPFLGL